MIKLFKLGHLLLRLFCGTALALLALAQLGLLYPRPSYAPAQSVFLTTDIFVVDFLLQVLLITISIWILFGIRTRVVAGFAALVLWAQLVTVAATAQGQWPMGQFFLGSLFTVLAISLVLLALLGGGRFALYPRGWRNISL